MTSGLDHRTADQVFSLREHYYSQVRPLHMLERIGETLSMIDVSMMYTSSSIDCGTALEVGGVLFSLPGVT